MTPEVWRLWSALVTVVVLTALLRAAGPLLVGARRLPPAVAHCVALLTPALLTGLVVVALSGPADDAAEAAQLVGVGVAGLARLLGAPLLLSVLVGMTTTAGLRLL